MPVLRVLFLSETPQSKNKTGELGSWFTETYNELMNWLSATSKGNPLQFLLTLCFALVLVTVLKNISRFLAMNFMVLIRNRGVSDMRKNTYEKILKLPVAYFNDEKKGDLLSRLSNDMKEIEFALMVSLEALYFQPLNIIIFLSALIVLSPKLSLYIILFLPITALAIAIIGKSLRKKSVRNQQLAGRILSMFEETISGIRIIKAFNVSSYFTNKYKKEEEEFIENNIGVQRRYDAASPVSETLGITMSAVLLWFGGNMVFNKELNPEFFLTYFAIFSQLIPPFKQFSSAIYAAQKGMASLERIEQLVDAPETVSDLPTTDFPAFEKSLSFHNISFSYLQNPVIEEFSLDIKKGETVAIVGPSGSGKTTLTDLISRFYDVQKGEICLDGKDIRHFKQDDLRKLIGIVAQESILFNDTIENNIRIGKLEASQEEIISAAKSANALEFIQKSEMGFDTNIGERGSKLSGGQKQRISIARALLKNPQILILDEATSALDSESEKLVQQALEELMKNRTSIVIAHRLSTVVHADRIVVLEKGRIAEIGSHSELMSKKGKYFNLIQLQQLS